MCLRRVLSCNAPELQALREVLRSNVRQIAAASKVHAGVVTTKQNSFCIDRSHYARERLSTLLTSSSTRRGCTALSCGSGLVRLETTGPGRSRDGIRTTGSRVLMDRRDVAP